MFLQLLYEENLTKLQHKLFLYFPVSYICLDTYTKNLYPSDLRKLVFWTEC